MNAVAFSPGGTSIAAGSSDDDVLVWNVATRALTATLPHPQPVTSLAWAGSGHLVSGDADGTARIWTLPTPVLLAGDPVNSVAFSPGGGMLAVGSRDLELWDPVTRQRLAARPVPVPGPVTARFVNAVAFAPHGQLLAAGVRRRADPAVAGGRSAHAAQPAGPRGRGRPGGVGGVQPGRQNPRHRR